MSVEQQQQLWNNFLSRWPRKKLTELTLEQYVSVNNEDTFTYWLETKTRSLGSIQGNTSAKFGIYKRGSESKEQNGIRHGEVYTWRTRYGNNETEVFTFVKNEIIKLAQAAYEGDLESIDQIDFSPMVKWKIAFLYQNQDSPVLINIFTKAMLEVLTSNDHKASFPEMHRKLIADKGETDLLGFGAKCWKIAEQKKKEAEQRSLLGQFAHVEVFNRYITQWSPEILDAFCSLIKESYKNKLDVFTTSMLSGPMIRIGRKELGEFKTEDIFATFEPTKMKINFEQRYQHPDGYAQSEVTNQLFQRMRKSKVLAQFTKQYPIVREAYWPISYLDNNQDYEVDGLADEHESKENGESYRMSSSTSLNQILYGPPGTGKTYHTIEAAVKAAEPIFKWENRKELKAKYEELVNAKRIRFVTFHQNYGYEEFVEGLCAEMTEDKQVTYRIKDGIFKQICNASVVSEMHIDSLIASNGRVWKLSIEGAYKNETKMYCLENNLAAIGWSDTGDLSKEDRNEYFLNQGSNNQNSLTYFSSEMAIGDLVLCIDSNTSVEAVGVVIGEYRYIQEGLPSGKDYCHQLPIKWLAKNFSVDFKALNGNKQFTLPTCYPLGRLSVSDVLNHLQSNNVYMGTKSEVAINEQKRNYVLVIDEINRGNISKIFGELITLIEPCKRKGGEEALELTLPYSGKPFSVPHNLYIIGTMNTADRSLAMIDTALRRRFDFIEMMPKPELLKDVNVKGIDLKRLLATLNQRIEILYDREHTLGHAFFSLVKALYDTDKKESAFIELQSVFKNKIIPLLEEYFFDDWSKIRLVLGDNQKDEAWQFISEHSHTHQELSELFGSKHNLDQYGQSLVRYRLASDSSEVWVNPAAYIGIYQQATSTERQEDSNHSEALE